MIGSLIATTDNAAYSPLAFQGILAFTQYPQIYDMLRNKFGDDVAHIFAQPVENKSQSQIDWYSFSPSTPQPLSELPEQLKNEILQKTASIANQIKIYADELINSGQPLKATRGRILNLCLEYPGENCIYQADGQPIIICWGFVAGAKGVEPHNLAKLNTPAPIQPEAPAEQIPGPAPIQAVPMQAKPKNLGWLWLLLPLLLLILLTLLLFTSFGSQPPLAGRALIHGPEIFPQTAKSDLSGQIAEMEVEIARLQSALERRIESCIPEKAPPAQNPPPPQPGQPAEENLRIPSQAVDASFLEGKWLCETGLMSSRNREPIQVEFVFDKNGQGHGIVYEKDDHCLGQVAAEMIDGKLNISLGEQRCQKNHNSYAPVRIICENASDSTTQCHGIHSSGTGWKANFKKIK